MQKETINGQEAGIEEQEELEIEEDQETGIEEPDIIIIKQEKWLRRLERPEVMEVVLKKDINIILEDQEVHHLHQQKIENYQINIERCLKDI